MKLRILDLSPLPHKGKTLNIVDGNPRGPLCGSGWIRAIQLLFREMGYWWASRNGLETLTLAAFKLFSEQASLPLSRELERQ